MPPEACHGGAKPRRAVDEKQNCGLRVGEANNLAMVSFGFTVVAVSPDRAASDHSMRARMPESVSTALLGPKERTGSVP